MSPPMPMAVTKSDTLLEYVTVAASVLQNIADCSDVPFLHTISSLSIAILKTVDSVKTNKHECALMIDYIHKIQYSIINICMGSETGRILTPTVLHRLAFFSETLQKIYSLMQTQLEMNKLKRFLRQKELSAQLEDCNTRLQDTLHFLSIQCGVDTISSLSEMKADAVARHTELLSLIADATDSDGSSSLKTYQSQSSGAFSLLPSVPKIFHGRESELHHVVQTLLGAAACVAILGTGGIGKTSLAKAVLHHPEIARIFSQRYFISCDPATNANTLISITAKHFRLEQQSQSGNVAANIIHHLAKVTPTLLIFDNFETPWEPAGSRVQVEEFLSLLTDVDGLALLITMRGAERPGRVRWTRPFLLPLNPLSPLAARQMFTDIADDICEDTDIDELLGLTDNVPLAVSLVANIVGSEGGCGTILARWKRESTALLSKGYDQRSNLDISIMLSLSSPRMRSSAHAEELLSLLSVLPDGILETDLLQSGIPLPDIQKHKGTLLRTALAYVDHDDRIKVLAPIREYVRNVHPPQPRLINPARQHLHELVMLWKDFQQMPSDAIVARIVPNLGNLHSVLLLGLNENDPHLRSTIYGVLYLNSFCMMTGRGTTHLMAHVPQLLDRLGDHRLHVLHITELFHLVEYQQIEDAEGLRRRAEEHFKLIEDPNLEARFYNVLGNYYRDHDGNACDIPRVLECYTRALSLSTDTSAGEQHCRALDAIAQVQWQIGNYRTSQKQAQKAQHYAAALGNLFREANSIYTETASCIAIGDFSRCLDLIAKARILLSVCGLQGGELENGLDNVAAEIHLLKTEYAESRSLNQDIANKTSKTKSPLAYGYAMANLAYIDITIGAEEDKIRDSMDAARSTFSAMAFSDGVLVVDAFLAGLDLREGRLQQAKSEYRRCFAASRGKDAELSIHSLEKLGDPMFYEKDEVQCVFRWAVIFLALARKSQHKLATIKAVRCLGDIFIAHGDDDTAHVLFDIALEEFTTMDVHRGRADCMTRMGDILNRRGDLLGASDMWKTAAALFFRCLQRRDAARVEAKLESLPVEYME